MHDSVSNEQDTQGEHWTRNHEPRMRRVFIDAIMCKDVILLCTPCPLNGNIVVSIVIVIESNRDSSEDNYNTINTIDIYHHIILLLFATGKYDVPYLSVQQ